MSFQDLVTEIQFLKPVENRAQKADYLEVVVERDHLEPLSKVLTAYFGAPLKPEGQSPSGKASELAKPYGGIRQDQTMYCRQTPQHNEFALLWPWGNGVRVTAKIIQAAPSPQASSFLGRLFGRKS